MFLNSKEIKEIDCSHFNCLFITSCISMFENCDSLTKINFGMLDFPLVTNFERMFCGCINLRELDVSKFKSSKCEYISQMFKNCKSITEINMINWNLENLKDSWVFGNGIEDLFCGCKKLNNIKLNTNFNNKKLKNISVFNGIPKYGTFTWKKDSKNTLFLQYLPTTWEKYEE